MSPRPRERLPTSLLLSYLDDELGSDEAAAVERTSVDSASVRRRLEALGTLRRALGAPVSALEARDLDHDLHAEAERQGRAREGRASRGGGPRSALVPRGWLALGACALVLVGVGLGQLSPRPEEVPSTHESEFRAKSSSPASPSRWAGIRAFRLAPGGTPERLRKRLHPEDGLLFAYSNLGSEPFEHLMVFCVDAVSELHWFYPAYVSERDNPSSITIQVGQELALAEVVWLDLPKGPLTIYGAFTREPLDVWAVEAWFDTHPEGGAGFAGPGAAVSRLAVTVE